MLTTTLAGSLAALVLAAPLAPQQPDQAQPFDFAREWAATTEAFHADCERQRVVGASLMFVRGAEVLGFEAHGFADRASDRRVDRDTIYHWASITKTFTGIAVMQLRDREQLRLDQPIVELVPEVSQAHNEHGEMRDITVRHLLSHSGGFRMATWPWSDKPWHPHEPTQWSQLVAMMPYTEVEFPPGSRFSYSNPGIVFLGRAIESLAGEDYEVYMHKNVLGPLGMHRAYFDITPYHLARHRSHSYRRSANGESTDLGPDFDTGITVSNGGLNAPLPDMAKYLAFLLGAVDGDSDAAAAGVLRRESLTEMWQPGNPTSRTAGERMGLTFFLQERSGQQFVTHTGGQRSFVTFFYVHPASGTGALGAFNTGTGGPVMAAMRRRCMERLSLPMAGKRQ